MKNTQFMPFQASNKYGVPVTYLQEYKPLGTGETQITNSKYISWESNME